LNFREHDRISEIKYVSALVLGWPVKPDKAEANYEHGEVSENSNALWHHHLPTSATLAHEIGGGDRIFRYYGDKGKGVPATSHSAEFNYLEWSGRG
jgi:hypothetical protein